MLLLKSQRIPRSLLHQPRYMAAVNAFLSTENHKKVSSSALSEKIKIYGELSKFRLSSLVVLTSGAGFLCAGAPVDMYTMAAATFGTALCAASAGTFNQVIERNRDSNMKRTNKRPLPAGKVGVIEATSWGITTGLVGTGMLYSLTNPIVAALGLGNIILYAGPYTYSKQYTELNTWIGSLVGAIPPVMGWAAATGGDFISPEPIALASILYLWQFPHFFSLSWLHREDYARGNFQMVAVNDALGNRSADLIMKYSIYLTILPAITSSLGMTSWMFLVESAAMNSYLLHLAYKFQSDHTNANARKIFLCSLWYLPLLLTAYVFHSRTWDSELNTDDSHINQLKAKLREICVHEIMVVNNKDSHDSNSNTSLPCLKTSTDRTINTVTDKTADVITTINNTNSDIKKM